MLLPASITFDTIMSILLSVKFPKLVFVVDSGTMTLFAQIIIVTGFASVAISSYVNFTAAITVYEDMHMLMTIISFVFMFWMQVFLFTQLTLVDIPA